MGVMRGGLKWATAGLRVSRSSRANVSCIYCNEYRADKQRQNEPWAYPYKVADGEHWR